MVDKTFLSEYYGDGNGRSAQIHKGPEGYSVVFLKNEQVVETRMLHEHNNYYAEDTAENWVKEIIK